MSDAIQGRLFDHKSSAAQAGTIHVDDHGLLTFAPTGGDGAQRLCTMSEVKVSDRIGNIPRRLELPSGQAFETTDNDGIDALLARFGRGKVMGKIAWLEGHGKLAFVALVLTLVIILSAFRWGVPVVSKQVAFALPSSVVQSIGSDTLPILDRIVFNPSALSLEEQTRVRQIFRRLQENHPKAQNYRLAIRDGGAIGPNAFALPGGQLVITDQLWLLAERPDEIAGVLAHEIAHVDNRHATRKVLEASALPLIIVWLTGDVDGATDVLINAPTMFISAAHSRSFEREADQDGAMIAARAGYDPRALGTILQKMTEDCAPECRGDNFLSSHPPTDERQDAIDQAAETYRPEIAL